MGLGWLALTGDDLKFELQQCREEGKDVSSIKGRFQRMGRTGIGKDWQSQERARALLDEAAALPQVKDWPYREPSDLAGIRRQRPHGPREIALRLSDAALFDRVHGAWLGRIAGCILGKPYEGWRRRRMWPFLKETGQYPLDRYFSVVGLSDKLMRKYKINPKAFSIEKYKFAPRDDDTNYTVLGMAILKARGRDFTPQMVAEYWLKNMPILETCTAERVAYRNCSNWVWPPESATFRNPYREWIGAQIRADFFGYAAMGRPQYAAELAWRDASISHVKNGIYGEMWVAAMLAAAPAVDDVATVIRIGLSEVPRKSRLAEGIHDVLTWRADGLTYDAAVARIHKRWDEDNQHEWTHTISNAQIVALALLWGEMDFGKTISRAVQACFDTDCNGATAGSVLGMILGAKALPRKWTAPLHGKLQTGVVGYHLVRIADLAKEGFEIYRKMRSAG